MVEGQGNGQAGELAASQSKLERSRLELERKHGEVEERRRYIETVLERIATGVVSIGPGGQIETVNSAAVRLLGIDDAVAGRPADAVFDREDLRGLQRIVRRAQGPSGGPVVEEVALTRQGREVHLSAAATRLPAEDSGRAGTVLVLRMWSRCTFSAGSNGAISPVTPRATTTEISRRNGMKPDR